MSVLHFDVLVVGAGISGIGAGYHLQAHCPTKSYAILEGRSDIGGTWDLFRYPGVRSDSDMFTLGYSFRPWKAAQAIADGPSILTYLRETAREFGIDRHIRFNHRVQTAAWSSEESRWTVDAIVGEDQQPVRYTCNFLYLCSGYYDYKSGYAPAFAGSKDFEGQLVHPQHWPQDLDYRDKRVVVIGSGATAVTLVPAMADKAAHVTMLQRSPTYIASLPSEDSIARIARRLLPESTAHRLIRWKNVLLGIYFYQLCRRTPELAKKLLRRGLTRELPPDFDIDTHFKPRYQPWDQRVCLVPDSDLFREIKAARVSVVTDQIEKFTRNGILLKSGAELPADIIVTATGLNLLACGGIRMVVDGALVEPGRTVSYKGLMLSGVPNCAAVCRLHDRVLRRCVRTCRRRTSAGCLNHMDRFGFKQCVARNDDPALASQPLLGLNSGYVRRGISLFPRQGAKAPWLLHQNYIRDLIAMRFGTVDDGTLMFSKGGSAIAPRTESHLIPVDAQEATTST